MINCYPVETSTRRDSRTSIRPVSLRYWIAACRAHLAAGSNWPGLIKHNTFRNSKAINVGIAGAAMLSLQLGGCAAISGFPEPIANTKSELATLTEFLGKDASDKYLATNDSDRHDMSRKQWRNEVVEARVRAADLKYGDF